MLTLPPLPPLPLPDHLRCLISTLFTPSAPSFPLPPAETSVRFSTLLEPIRLLPPPPTPPPPPASGMTQTPPDRRILFRTFALVFVSESDTA